MIAIIDYGMGNLRSVQKALEKAGANAQITQSADEIQSAEKLVLPGVGAMRPAMEKLKSLDLIATLKQNIDAGKPFLGICLGFQLLFETGDEGGNVSGLGFLKGEVKRFTSLRVPQIGWNQLSFKNNDSPLFNGIEKDSYAYFCHSYFVNPSEPAIIAATTDYGVKFTSAVQKGNILGVQFHPEKSQSVGLKILKNFVEWEQN